ncbi:hypothetical protein OHA37_17675 [Streptomyces sp. NBC_00335]|uniref:hypothetical protein n=1 Tax=unclassified Streptomyces TaxID=2593676 RepID=UPI002252E95E|nr:MULTISPECIES: hypothetical protein [unclassified Streptomyces]MCX5405710.1 hypothetical protein [Streptomyces sp. NBC_00086]
MAGIVDVPWWAGVFRWVTLARAAVRVFALYGGISAAYADPTVSLRVVGRSSDERTCVVGWRDRAFGDGERTADFRCSAKAATYHPWRGRLHEVDEAGPGTRRTGLPGTLGAATALSGIALGLHRNFAW